MSNEPSAPSVRLVLIVIVSLPCESGPETVSVPARDASNGADRLDDEDGGAVTGPDDGAGWLPVAALVPSVLAPAALVPSNDVGVPARRAQPGWSGPARAKSTRPIGAITLAAPARMRCRSCRGQPAATRHQTANTTAARHTRSRSKNALLLVSVPVPRACR